MIENKELKKCHKNIQEEIKSALISEEEGGTPEQLFTEYALSALAENGETENYRVTYDEKISKRGIEHKINGYALHENYESLDLFVTIYNHEKDIKIVTKTNAEKALGRLVKFLRNAVSRNYVHEIEESSEIFDLAQTLAKSKDIKESLVRVNVFLLTNGEVKSKIKTSSKTEGIPVFYRVVDIHYLFNLVEKSGVPIELDFAGNGIVIPCIPHLSENKDYHSYLAIFPGSALADIYEQYGPRLLEQNVRSFLQFTGKINKGIRQTIIEEPHMFLAFNNGITATAEEVQLTDTPGNNGKTIGYVRDFQIVNGGQTTASIYHTWKKNKSDLSKIFVPLKLTIINNRENFGEIVSRIAEYANTQNKVSASDLSSNRENLVALEKLSRSLWAPPKPGEMHQTRWFFERTRGQYKNEKARFSTTPSRKKQFEKQNPKSQMFTKELLAKYINSWKESCQNGRLVTGPHTVVRGSQKNYALFLNYNFTDKPGHIFFEDAVALAILFKSTEKIYGVKPNSLGDMRYIAVPYSIAWIGYKTNYSLNLYKIWKNQEISTELSRKFRELMVKIENYIKQNAPGSLYGEWAKKEECWFQIKQQDFDISLKELADDLDSDFNNNRRKLTKEDTEKAEIQTVLERLQSVHPEIWKKIEAWGKETGKLTQYQRDIANTIANRLSSRKEISETERKQGGKILDMADNYPDLFLDMEEFFLEDESEVIAKIDITANLIHQIMEWNKENRLLDPRQHRFLEYLADGKVKNVGKIKYIAACLYNKAKKHGFSESFVSEESKKALQTF
ncbi:MAG: AIPR family protein [Thermodesulfobacteriota bacterium]|nr:AIPR family protein [Thermodesulfobacteriota bacterium]